MEIGDVPIDNHHKYQRIAEVPIQEEGDYPIYMHDFGNQRALAVLTLRGYLYIYYILPEPFIAYQAKVSETCPLGMSMNRDSGGLVLINEAGQLIEVEIGDEFISRMFDLKI